MDDAGQILAPDRLRIGPRRVRIYAGPRWVRPDGKSWARIHEVARAVALDGGGYVVTYRGEGVQLVPHAADAAALADAQNSSQIEGAHFGPVLDAKLAPEVLRWNVLAGPKVKRERDAWILGEPDGVKLGLFLNDWRRRFGDRCIVEGDRVTLDLTEAKKAALAPAGTREINLDPVVWAGAETGPIQSNPQGGQSWADARDNPLNTDSGILNTFGCVAVDLTTPPTVYHIRRGYLQFATAGVGTVLSATLYVMHHSSKADEGSILVFRIDDYGERTVADWDQAPHPVNDLVTTLVVSELGGEESIEVDPSHVDTEGNTCFWFQEKDHDNAGDGSPPGANEEYGAIFLSYDWPEPPTAQPHLDLEVVTTVAGGMMRTGLGR